MCRSATHRSPPTARHRRYGAVLAGVSSLMFVAFTVYGVIKFYAVRFAYRVAFHDPQVWHCH